MAHAHTGGPFAAVALSLATRKVVTAHLTPESLADSILGGHAAAGLSQRYLRWFYDNADVVVALSGHQREQLRAMGVTSDIQVIPNSAVVFSGESRCDARRQLGIGADEQVVVSVGQLQPRKGVRDFHECAVAMPDVRFVWVGGFPLGRLTAEYASMVDLVRAGAANVRHVGRLPRNGSTSSTGRLTSISIRVTRSMPRSRCSRRPRQAFPSCCGIWRVIAPSTAAVISPDRIR